MKHLSTSAVYGVITSIFCTSVYILIRLAELVTGSSTADPGSILFDAIVVFLVVTMLLTFLFAGIQDCLDSLNKKPPYRRDDDWPPKS
ncbi:MAG: hypothetical protein K8F91_01610 [Candidatus Obscuribacterales bacterium]|nr:hypothetical protein [Candidatus Obscuribacterales bacterium]